MGNANRKEYSIYELLFGNLAIIAWIGLGSVAFGLYCPLASIVFFASAAFLVFYELGKHGCVNCYYCKTCTIGMGKLPELFFKPSGTANVNRRAMKLFTSIYVLLSLVPIALLSFSIAQESTAYKIVILAPLLGFSLISGTVRRKNFNIHQLKKV